MTCSATQDKAAEPASKCCMGIAYFNREMEKKGLAPVRQNPRFETGPIRCTNWADVVYYSCSVASASPKFNAMKETWTWVMFES